MRYLRRALPVFGCLGIAVGAAAVYVHVRADGAWQEMSAWAHAAQARQDARSCDREALFGATKAGSCWESYATARRLTASLGSRDAAVMKRYRKDPSTVTREELARLLGDWQPALAALREGAHRRDARHLAEWSLGLSNHTANLLDARALVNLAVVAAREELAAGRATAAVELLLDAATYGADHVASPVLIDRMVGCAVVTIATGEAWSDANLRALDAPALDLLATGLARLDARLPLRVDLETEAIFFVNSAQRTLGLWENDSRLASLWWRYGFSSRWSIADAALHQIRAFERFATVGGESWPERQRLLEREFDSAAVQANPMLVIAMPNLAGAERTQRMTTAIVRLLRVAVEVHRGGVAAPLLDPLGAGPFAVDRAGDKIVVRSATAHPSKLLERVVVIG